MASSSQRREYENERLAEAIVLQIIKYFDEIMGWEGVEKKEMENITRVVLHLLKHSQNPLGDVEIDFHGRSDEMDQFSMIFINAAVARALASTTRNGEYIFRRYFKAYSRSELLTDEDRSNIQNFTNQAFGLIHLHETADEAIKALTESGQTESPQE